MATDHTGLEPIRIIKRKRIWRNSFLLWQIYCKGKKDGKKDLPRLDAESGVWRSPFIDGKINQFNAFCDNEWFGCEINNQRRFVQLEGLLAQEEERLTQLDALSKELQAFNFNDPEYIDKVFGAERKLDKGLVEQRRRTELQGIFERRSAFYRSMCASFEGDWDVLIKTVATIEELENSTRLYCEEARDLYQEQTARYWDGVICKHSLKGSLPPYPTEMPSPTCRPKTPAFHPSKDYQRQDYSPLTFAEETYVFYNKHRATWERIEVAEDYYRHIRERL